MVIMASGIARGRVGTTTTTTTTAELPNMAAILQKIGWQRHAALVYRVLPWYWTSMLDQLTPVKTRYPLTSIMWPECGLEFTATRGHVFFWSWLLTKCWLSIWSRAHIRLTCWKQGRIVRKPVNANPGLKVNQIITFSSIQMFFVVLFCVHGDY